MTFHETSIVGVYEVTLEPKGDERGYLMRTFCEEEFAQHGLPFPLKQTNETYTQQKGVLRGLHWQDPPKAEDKVVRCSRGIIFDVAVDLRPESPTYGSWHAAELSDENKKMLIIPKGCAHGMQTCSMDCVVQYFMSEFYAPEYQRGLAWDDPELNIPWPINNPILSEKDQHNPTLADL